MTQENKELLLKDLSGRLPYGVKFLRESWNYEWDQELSVIEVLEDIDKDGYINNTKVYKIEDIKPYLRPMSSMTEEERKEFNSLINGVEERCINAYGKGGYTLAFIKVNDWLNTHHFDYRGLIPMGIALEAPEEMYK